MEITYEIDKAGEMYAHKLETQRLQRIKKKRMHILLKNLDDAKTYAERLQRQALRMLNEHLHTMGGRKLMRGRYIYSDTFSSPHDGYLCYRIEEVWADDEGMHFRKSPYVFKSTNTIYYITVKRSVCESGEWVMRDVKVPRIEKHEPWYKPLDSFQDCVEELKEGTLPTTTLLDIIDDLCKGWSNPMKKAKK